ncbi:COBRA-like protein 1 [Tasmannia lanceolata]|uniref:COBRA-like protein 1 n=1 Tax=Tasmannia lanceolata TaxID=3420 RepID=UPI0040637E22
MERVLPVMVTGHELVKDKTMYGSRQLVGSWWVKRRCTISYPSLPENLQEKNEVTPFMDKAFSTDYFVDCYDPVDPNGNITLTFDIYKWTQDGYVATVTIQNYYKYRHVEKPGWQLGWSWTSNEVIWSMTGALATQQGNCSAFKFQIPYSCKKDPVIVDLMPEALAENRSENCCKDGLLAGWAIDQANSFSSFEIVVGNLESNSSGHLPQNLTFMVPGPGYTCGPFADYPPTVFSVHDGRREAQVFRTWKSICTYSSFIANKAPICCVSLSSFYNPTITSCPSCSCGCRFFGDENTNATCVGDNDVPGEAFSVYNNIIRCTNHMCPIRVHWHVKTNYREYWRVKLTISNYNFGTNYSDWNLMIQHPGFSQKFMSYSFNSTTLDSLGYAGKRLIDDVGLFWGFDNYNSELLQTIQKNIGSVTTEIILQKDLNTFTLRNGWTFPRRVYFNGENCEMPLPDDFPALPDEL